MADVFTRNRRSEIMSRIRGRDTKPEILLLKLLKVSGLRVLRHVASLPGTPEFVLPKERLKGPDEAFIEATVRPWLEPIPIAEATRTCSPSSGTPVRTWTSVTTLDEIEADLGPADARAQTARGEALVYGSLRLRFEDGKLAGVEKRKGS